ncbi:MAG TPA: NADH-quinone oxidoreductase subunit M [Verrucomicrobiae bacterium]|nr:NADH-quinone oxidoreductase subunit M [Verrucomicrobiae bacterium]
MNGLPFITLLTLLPLIGGVIVIGLGDRNKNLPRNVALGINFLTLILTLILWSSFNSTSGGFQFEERHLWIATLGIEYRVAIDGLGLLMLLLTAIITPMAIIAAKNQFSLTPSLSDPIGGGVTGDAPVNARDSHWYYGLVLFLQAGLFGTFTALNFFHWFLFWELSLIPAFFLVRLWGGPLRTSAATQFFIYTMVGSIGLLLSFLAIFLATGHVSDFTALAEMARNGELIPALSSNLSWFGLNSKTLVTMIFFGALLGFAVKVPLFPFHTWLPATYSEASSGTTMLLTGVMSKMGVYGFLRILLPIFPEPLQWFRTPLLVLAVITIVFSASAAFAQKDLKRIFAYSSINHLGYCLLAIFAVATSTNAVPNPALEKTAALNGVLLQMFNHGLTAATLFWFVALIEKRSGGWRGIDDFGGLRKVAPVFCGLMGIALFSSLGLPGLNGFIGEFLIFKGVFPLAMGATSFAVIGLLVTAIFILTILQRVFNGPLNEKRLRFSDVTLAERIQLGIPIALMFVLGLYPQIVLEFINATIVQMVKQLPF